MTTLFDLRQFETIKHVADPYWDEIVLDCSGKIDGGQLTLFYDASEEPPDPDDFQNLEDYEAAFEKWRSQFPDVNIQEMSVLEDEETRVSPLPEQRKTQWVEEYYVLRGGTKHWYFRYCFYQNKRIVHIHIPGGNSRSAIALERVERVRSAIDNAASPIEIQNLIRGGFQN